MIDDQINGAERVDFHWINSKFFNGISHSGQIDDGRNTSEILQDDSGGLERDLHILVGGLLPVEDIFDVLLLDAEVVAVSDGRLKKNSDGIRELFLVSRFYRFWSL